MTVIAGSTSSDRPDDERTCRVQLDAMPAVRPAGAPAPTVTVRGSRGAVFGISLDHYLPEDRYDRQPLADRMAAELFVADARIDNREELAAALGLHRARALRTSDGELLHLAWEKWEDDAPRYVLGDYAFAHWNGADLHLVRSPFSQRSLFYGWVGGRAVFASLPEGILALGLPSQPNLKTAAGVVSFLPPHGPDTMFAGIGLVPKGMRVTLANGCATHRSLYDLRPAAITLRSLGEAGEALRAELDRATRAQLRRSWGNVAAQLSAGRDSNAVATTAARHLLGRSESLLVLTGAPSEPWEPPNVRDRIFDESPWAAATAAAHPNMWHRVCRGYRPVEEDLRSAHEIHHAPLLNASNIPWWDESMRVAAGEGASVLLTGQSGNHSISAGGEEHLRDLWRDIGTGGWWRMMAGLNGRSWNLWRRSLALTLGPGLPAAAYAGLRRLSGRDADVPEVRFLRPAWRREMGPAIDAAFADERPPSNFYEFRKSLLLGADTPDRMALRRWGIDLRDPTLDRQLIELAFAIPARFLVSAKGGRPAFDAAFGDRIPVAVLRNSRRGYQGADWANHFRPEVLRSMSKAARAHPAVDDLLDLDGIDRAIDEWPSRDLTDPSSRALYAGEMLTALSVAHFLVRRFP